MFPLHYINVHIIHEPEGGHELLRRRLRVTLTQPVQLRPHPRPQARPDLRRARAACVLVYAHILAYARRLTYCIDMRPDLRRASPAPAGSSVRAHIGSERPRLAQRAHVRSCARARAHRPGPNSAGGGGGGLRMCACLRVRAWTRACLRACRVRDGGLLCWRRRVRGAHGAGGEGGRCDLGAGGNDGPGGDHPEVEALRRRAEWVRVCVSVRVSACVCVGVCGPGGDQPEVKAFQRRSGACVCKCVGECVSV
jgi:hypothetical protein